MRAYAVAPRRIYHVIRALSACSAVMSHYYTYNVVLALITEGQWWESVSTPELRTSTLNKAHPKKTRREKFVGAANQPECEKKWI